MAYIDEQLKLFKNMIENSIIQGGTVGKESCIRSSALINIIHDAVKYELIEYGIRRDFIFPHLGETKPEIKLAGFLKQKKQDICIIPGEMEKNPENISWGPLAFQNKYDLYGYEYSTNTLVINIRSQMSSLSKNSDTLFERTFAESMNLHMRYPNIVLGEVYLIPLYEYDDELVKRNKVGFKNRHTDVERYISFFNSINNRVNNGDVYKYERCALLIVDFRPENPILYRSIEELKATGSVSESFMPDYSSLSFDTFAKDIISIYAERYRIENIQEISQINRINNYACKIKKDI